MNEDFLQYIWRFQKFTDYGLRTVTGEVVTVVAPGVQNFDAGPDFLNARVRIGGTEWAGNVEVHIRASDWFRHRHHEDRAYDNVILHVVYTADKEILSPSGQAVPTLCIKDLIDYQSWRYYKSWLKNSAFIPCEKLVGDVPDIVKISTVEAAFSDRLRDKSALCFDHLNETRGDTEAVFYRMLMRAFGLKVNAMPFEQLSRILPFSLLRKVWDDLADTEALFLGQAGFLEQNSFEAEYAFALAKRYAFLKNKFGLEPMPPTAWKLFRLRPQNFPAVRLAQVATFYHRHRAVARKIAETDKPEKLFELFDIELQGDFWNRHYTLAKAGKPAVKKVGETARNLIVINAVVPFLFASGRYGKDESLRQRAAEITEMLPPENNKIVREFRSLGFRADNAMDTQGLLQLKKFGCDAGKCLTCKTGTYTLERYERTR